MKGDNTNDFPAKVLLFGEYTALLQSDILAVPLNKFYGTWKFNPGIDNSSLVSLARYLTHSRYSELFQKDVFLDDIKKGLYFDSGINPGYGIGSSGALAAAVFDSYYKQKYGNLNDIKEILASIESFFHGTSSGIDPLVSFTRKGVFFSKNKISLIDSPYRGTNHFYLLDSGIKRSTSHFVKIFNDKRNNTAFLNNALNPLIRLNNEIIKLYLNNSDENVFTIFRDISHIQFDFFKEMIPEKLLPLWEKTLSLPDIKIKLCGAGGGGYFLIITKTENLPGFLSEKFGIIKL